MAHSSAQKFLGWLGILAGTLLTAGLRLRHLSQLEDVPARAGLTGLRAVASGDSAYHLRRIAWYSDHGQLLKNDPWTHFPSGNAVVWPDGFDLLAGALARLIGPPGSLDAALTAGIALVTVLSMATALLAGALAWRWTGQARAGLMASLIIAVHPGLQNYAQAGKIDHHSAEPLVTFGALGALLAVAETADLPRRRLAQGLSVIALLASLWLLPSSSLTVALLAVLAALRVLLAPHQTRQAVSRRLAVPLAVAGLLGLPLGLQSPFGAGGAAVGHALSLLQPGMLLTAGAALAAAGQVRGQGTPAALGAMAAMLGTVALALGLWPAGREALLGGGDFVQGRGYVGLIQESMSAWESGLERSAALLSVGFVALPALAWWGWRRDGQPAARVWTAAALIAGALALLQLRFAPLTAVPLAVMSAAALSQLAQEKPRGWSLAAMALLLLPGAVQIGQREPPLGRRVAVWQALRWLQAHDPQPQSATDPTAQPDHTLLASWSLGHDLLVFGGRANLCSPLIAPGQTRGLDACLQLTLGTTPEKTAALLEEFKPRWWLVTPWSLAAMRAYAAALGQNPSDFAAPGADGRMAPTRRGLCAPGQQLWHGLGSAPPDGSCRALPQWRLVWQAQGGAKLFAQVRGARVRLHGCLPGTLARLEARLAVGGEGALWLDMAAVQADGSADLATPWSTDFRSDNMRLIDQRVLCQRKASAEAIALDVSENAVQLGLAIDVSPPGL